MRPFDPPAQGDTGVQIDFDARRARYLECLAVRAFLKADAYDRWKAGKGEVTLCDAVAAVGLRALDPGLEDVRDSLAELPPDEQTSRLRDRLKADDRTGALARAILARGHPERVDEIFGWSRTGIDRSAYWAPQLESVHMEYLLDTADFGANELLRILYLLAEVPEHLRDDARRWRDPETLGCDPNFPQDGAERLRATFTEFKYWFDDPFRCSEFTGRAKEIREQSTDEGKRINHHEKMDPGADMTYWSENHRLLFGAAEYLAGQYWPDDMFVSARRYRKEGPDGPTRKGDVAGADHRERGRRRVLRWLNERLRMGFAEWNAPGYYVEDVLPLVNLADFSTDEAVRTRAAMVLDVLVLDLALHQMGGAFAGSAGRAYFEHKNCVWDQSVRDCAELVFGNRGHFVAPSNAAIFLATSPVYDPPDVLVELGARPPDRFTSRSRVSITFEEAAEYGVGFRSPDDMEFWWSRAAYATKQTIVASKQVATDNGLRDTPPFKDILPMIESAAKAIDTAEDVGAGILGGIGGAVVGFAVGGPVGAIAGGAAGAYAGANEPDFDLADAADMASVITEGSVLTRANLYAHRSGDALLASVQDFRRGQLNFQSWPCVAALSNGAMVWTTYPSAGSRLKLGLGSTTWALIGAVVGGPIGLGVGALFMPDVDLVDEELFKADDHNGPNWWTGNVVQPRVVQQYGAAIAAYQAKDIQKLLFGQRTHAWFPRNQFDRTIGPVSGRCNLDSARWFFGSAGDGYVALLCAREATWTDNGDGKDKEIRAEGPSNVFITQIGSASEFGSFEGFMAAVTTARVRISGLHGVGELACGYDVPHGERLALHYDGSSRYGGRPAIEDEFPRMRNPFARIAWQQDRYAVQARGKSLVHDVVAGTRTLGGERAAIDHDTPLTFYAQNMGLLPGPLYKGIDRDRALDHLIGVLRERKPDLVGLSEMWSDGDRDRVVGELKDVYPHSLDGPHDPLVETPLGDLEAMGGGLLLLSRHPVVSKSSTVYRRCSGDDCLASKGALHARVQPRGHPCAVDVFLTHTQAPHPTLLGTTGGARAAVEAQIRHLAAFVRACRDAVCPAVLFGDFNVDYYGHRDLYDFLVATLGAPVDLEPVVPFDGRARPLATSESDDGVVSSFHGGHPLRAGDDGERFGKTAERLDYIFAFPGLLYAQHPASSRVVVEQWEPGRDMSDHYGVEGFIDVTTQFLPRDRPIVSVKVQPLGFQCLQTTSGPGDDEVAFTLTARPVPGAAASLTTPEIDDVEAGTGHAFDVAPFEIADPQDGLDLTVEGREIDSLSADDLLGRATLSYSRDELAAMADRGPARVAFPRLEGDGGEYVVELEISVDAPADAGRKPAHE
jgi:endonuclease/exonuclease/phosphatase family metal-dependent hydrolase